MNADVEISISVLNYVDANIYIFSFLALQIPPTLRKDLEGTLDVDI